MGTQPRTRGAPVVALGALVLLLAALASGTFDGLRWPSSRDDEPGGSGSGSGDRGGRSSGDGVDPGQPPRPTLPDSDTSPWVLPLLLLLVASALAVVVVALVVALSLRLVRRPRLHRGVGVRAGVTAAADEDPADDGADELGLALRDGLGTVAEGPPRNAIVATWLRLEEAATTERLPRHPADTPTEFVERALAAYGLDERAIRRLAVLYEEARFSRHPLTEQHRAEAQILLQRLLARLTEVSR